MFQNVIIGWIARRALELGGFAAAIFAWYMAQPASTQDAINHIFTGSWREVPVGIYIGIGAAIWGYVWSAQSTFKPQVVTSDRKQIPLSPTGAAEAEAIAKLRPKPRTLWDRLTGK